MLAGLVLSTSIPEAFGTRGISFADGLRAVCRLAARPSCYGRCASTTSGNFRNFQRITSWLALSALFWIAGAFADGHTVRAVGDRTHHRICLAGRRLLDARSRSFDHRGVARVRRAYGRTLWVVHHHRARRVDPGHRRDLRQDGLAAATIAAFAVSFVGSVAMWWIYFNIGAERAAEYARGHRTIPAVMRVSPTSTQLSCPPRGRHHRDGGVGRTDSGASRRSHRFQDGGDDADWAGFVSGRQPDLQAAARRQSRFVSHGWNGATCARGAAALFVPPLALGAITSAILVVVAIWETRSLGGYAPHQPAAKLVVVPVKPKARPKKRKRR